MADEKPKIGISAQFRQSAESLATMTSLVLRAAEARDEAEVNLGKLEGLVIGARAELKVREDAYKRIKEITEVQSTFFLGIMEEEANANIEHLRAVREATA